MYDIDAYSTSTKLVRVCVVLLFSGLSPRRCCFVSREMETETKRNEKKRKTSGPSGSRARAGAGASEVLCGGSTVVLHRRGRGLRGRAVVESFNAVPRLAAGA